LRALISRFQPIIIRCERRMRGFLSVSPGKANSMKIFGILHYFLNCAALSFL
jgi:hypothetical protein